MKNKQLDKIIFQGAEYPVTEIYSPEIGKVKISTASLNSQLLNENSIYISKEAELIDETIFYFVDDEAFNMPQKNLTDLIITQTS